MPDRGHIIIAPPPLAELLAWCNSSWLIGIAARTNTTRDCSLRNYKNNNKANYDLLEVDGKPRLKRVK
jgi:hypothetical protein